jgi:hypothetical protein
VVRIVINVLNACIVYLIYADLRGVFGYLDFRGVLIQVVSSSYKVASTLIIKTTSCIEPVLVEKVVEVVIVIVVEIV